MEILEKVAYMKGLAEGLGLDGQTKEGKLLTVMMDILDDMAAHGGAPSLELRRRLQVQAYTTTAELGRAHV